MDADVGKTVDKDGADFDDLEVDNNQVENVVGLGRLNLKTEAKLLLHGLGLHVVRAELVVALESFRILCVILVVLVVVLLLVGNLRSHEDVAEGVGVGVQLEAVDHQARLIDGEVEFEMAGVLLVVLLGFAVVVLEDGRASGTFDFDGLCLCLGLSCPHGIDGHNLDDFNVGLAELGRKEEGIGCGCQAGRGDEWSQQHDGCGSCDVFTEFTK